MQSAGGPESRRTVDPLAMALFGVARELPAADRRVLLSAIDGRLHGVAGERARVALEVLRLCERETQETVSKRRYERWRDAHPERESLPSSTYVANSLGGSWARAMDATGVAPSVEHATFRWHRQGPSPSDQEVLDELGRCAREVRVDFTFGEYREWALAQRASDPDRRGLLISPSTLSPASGPSPKRGSLRGWGSPAAIVARGAIAPSTRPKRASPWCEPRRATRTRRC